MHPKTVPISLLSLSIFCFFNLHYGARVRNSFESSHETSFSGFQTNDPMYSMPDVQHRQHAVYDPALIDPGTDPRLCNKKTGSLSRCVKECGYCRPRKYRRYSCRSTCTSVCPRAVVQHCRQSLPVHLVKYLDKIRAEETSSVIGKGF